MQKRLNYENIIHINEETGEEICRSRGTTTIMDSEMSKEDIKRREFLEKYDPHFNKGARFVKLYDGVLELLVQKLTKAELTFMFKLVRLVSYDDGVLRTGGHGNGVILDLDSISNIVGESYKNCNKLMNGLIKKGIVGKHQTGCVENPDIIIKCYTFNPYILSRGTKMSRTILSLFENSGWAH